MWKERIAILASPWMYSLSWLTGNSAWAERALRMDPCNLRALNLLPLPSDQRSTALDLRHAALLATLIGEDQTRRLVQMLANSHSQYHQDLVGLLAAGEKRSGYFVEVGAGDGTSLSNTLLMEQDYGWSGLLLEPNKSYREMILQSRRARLDTRAAFKSSGVQLQFVADDYLSRLAEPQEKFSSAIKESTYEVTTVTLDQALEEAGAPHEIDFVSVDTEGTEVSVLEGFDLTRWKVGMMTIEHNFDSNRRRRYTEILEPRGFVQVLATASSVDDWFIHRDYAPNFLKELRK